MMMELLQTINLHFLFQVSFKISVRLFILYYYYFPDADPINTYSVNASGALCIQQPLDREIDSIDYVTIQVQDLGSPSLSSNQTYTITITDRNDNVPHLITTIEVYSVDEDSDRESEVAVIDVLDIDIDVHAEVVYTLDDILVPRRDHFTLLPFEYLTAPNNERFQRSRLIVNAPLDFEEVQEYYLLLTLYNPSPFEGVNLDRLQVCHISIIL